MICQNKCKKRTEMMFQPFSCNDQKINHYISHINIVASFLDFDNSERVFMQSQ